MANISGINPASGPAPVQPNAAVRPARTQGTSQQSDTVEISLQAKIASKLAEVPDIRADLVADIKAQIQAGTYDAPEKMDIAIANLLEEL